MLCVRATSRQRRQRAFDCFRAGGRHEFLFPAEKSRTEQNRLQNGRHITTVTTTERPHSKSRQFVHHIQEFGLNPPLNITHKKYMYMDVYGVTMSSNQLRNTVEEKSQNWQTVAKCYRKASVFFIFTKKCKWTYINLRDVDSG